MTGRLVAMILGILLMVVGVLVSLMSFMRRRAFYSVRGGGRRGGGR
jgi:hypothetical protein